MGITTKIVVPPPGLLFMTTSLPNGSDLSGFVLFKNDVIRKVDVQN
jgi:hypothetical protein